MRLLSTRAGIGSAAYTFEEALFQGLAPDGGLFLPDTVAALPKASIAALRGTSLQETGIVLTQHLLGDEFDPDFVEGIVRSALDFPIPLVELGPSEYMLELFHGPTLAFKDVGARFMASMMSALRFGDAPLTVLVATSGDTGGAVADAFFRKPGVRVVVLFPLGKVSPRQERQFTTFGQNIHAVGIRGGFDDCQRLVKEAFGDSGLCARLSLTSANSINVGRLIPQAVYFAHAWASLPESAEDVVVSVPSGNFGNLTAGLLAKAAGVPISAFVAATNANRVVPDYFETGTFTPRPSIPTISNAMDVGNPSNFERVRHLFGGDVSMLRQTVRSSSWSDDATRGCIQDMFRSTGRIIDPHTAVGLLGLRAELAQRPGSSTGISLATAHPAKFAETVEPIVGKRIPIPPALERSMMAAPSFYEIAPKVGALLEIFAQLDS